MKRLVSYILLGIVLFALILLAYAYFEKSDDSARVEETTSLERADGVRSSPSYRLDDTISTPSERAR